MAAAREGDPDARLYINDYHILVGDYPAHRDFYEKIIAHLMGGETPVQGIGFQSHYHAHWQRRTPEQLMETLDRFAKFGVPLQATEFDAFGGWTKDRDLRERLVAEFMEVFYITLFSHHAVAGITMWGFWDGRHWYNEAPLFREDWSPKPGYHVYHRLVFKDWWTRETLTSDDEGRATVRAFLGDHTVSVTLDDGTRVERDVTLTPEGAEVELTIP